MMNKANKQTPPATQGQKGVGSQAPAPEMANVGITDSNKRQKSTKND